MVVYLFGHLITLYQLLRLCIKDDVWWGRFFYYETRYAGGHVEILRITTERLSKNILSAAWTWSGYLWRKNCTLLLYPRSSANVLVAIAMKEHEILNHSGVIFCSKWHRNIHQKLIYEGVTKSFRTESKTK